MELEKFKETVRFMNQDISSKSEKLALRNDLARAKILGNKLAVNKKRYLMGKHGGVLLPIIAEINETVLNLYQTVVGKVDSKMIGKIVQKINLRIKNGMVQSGTNSFQSARKLKQKIIKLEQFKIQ